ncbi:MAG: muramoyltetrapeptide carboxypeptidase [Clostridia bacterium]|nr:muramoyltetrapeptide carboxypeptidase [Clostridia bacterium]
MPVSQPLLKPPALQEGDTVGVAASASPLADKGYLVRGIRFWRRLGYRVRLGSSLRKALQLEAAAGQPAGYLAGSDAGRLADLHQMFRDPEVKALACLRGGYGTLRLLAGLDYDLIRSRPKILVGYSDITALHLALQKRTGLVTFHGPMLYPELGGPEVPAYTRASLLRALTMAVPLGTIPPAPGLPPPVTINPGRAEGPVTGGNLSLVVATLGTPFEIDTRAKILFLEEVDEAPYRIDRMLTQLKLAGKLQAAAGIVLGFFTRCGEEGVSPALLDIITALLRPLHIPCFYGLPAGHLSLQATLPLGIRAHLDATACTLTYLETAIAPVCK